MVILSLGSNTGDREAYLKAALSALSPMISGMRASRVLESKALLPEGAPAEWDRPFLNMAVRGETTLAPEALLARLKAIEVSLGRTPQGKWGPREIDIDILCIDGVVLNTPILTLPHPELIHRDFALLPLAELAPEWRLLTPGPYFNKTASEIAQARGFALGDQLRDTGMTLNG